MDAPEQERQFVALLDSCGLECWATIWREEPELRPLVTHVVRESFKRAEAEFLEVARSFYPAVVRRWAVFVESLFAADVDEGRAFVAALEKGVHSEGALA